MGNWEREPGVQTIPIKEILGIPTTNPAKVEAEVERLSEGGESNVLPKVLFVKERGKFVLDEATLPDIEKSTLYLNALVGLGRTFTRVMVSGTPRVKKNWLIEEEAVEEEEMHFTGEEVSDRAEAA